MWNIMLDEKPDNWNGYPVNTDFRIGIQVMLLLEDKELSDREKTDKVMDLLFPGIIPEDVTGAIRWFMGGWNHDKHGSRAESVKETDYDIDQWRIYSAFRSQYGIDLNTAELHFWEFMALLTTLEECAYTRVIDIRRRKIEAKMDKKEKQALKEAKKVYALEQPEKAESQEEKIMMQEAQDLFLNLMKKGG